MAGTSGAIQGAENGCGAGMFGGEASKEIWGMWRPRGSSADLSSARSTTGLSDAAPKAAAVSSRVASGLQLREEIVSAAGAAYEAETEARAVAGLLLLQHLFSPSVSVQILRPESYSVALAASIRTVDKWSRSPSSAVASDGLLALSCIFQSCAAIEGTASRSAGRAVAQVIDRERGWEVVLKSLQANPDEKMVQIGGAGSIWGLARWSRMPRTQMLAWMRRGAELLLACLERHGPLSLDVAKACSAALHLLCWRFPVHSNEDKEVDATAGDQSKDAHIACRQLDLSGANAQALLRCLDAHSGSEGLLLHVCGLLMLTSLAMRDRGDDSRDVGERAVRAGLCAARCLEGARSSNAGEAGGRVSEMVADRGWELLLVMSDRGQGGWGGNGQGGGDDVRRIMVQAGVLDAVWGVIRTGLDANDAKRHEICWRIARNLHPFADEGGIHRHALEHGGLDTVRWILPVLSQAMESGGLVEVQTWAVDTILRHLCPEVGDRNSTEGEGGHFEGCECTSCSVGREGAVVALSGAMSAHPRLAAVQSHALSALLHLSRCNQGNLLRAVRSGVVARTVDGIRGHIRSKRVQECAGRLLQLLCARSPQAMEQLQAEGGVTAVIDSLRYHGGDGGERLVGILCGVLHTASWGHEHRRTVAKEGGVAVVIEVMYAHPENVLVQRHACGCLHALSWSADCKAQIFRGKVGGGVLLLVKAMMLHSADAELQQEACSALAIVSYFVDTNKREICECGGIQAIIYAMQTHSSHRGIQEQGCLALWSLASRTPPPPPGEAAEDGVVEEEEEKDKIHSRNKASMANGRGIEVLVAAVRSHPRAVAVVERASRALVQLSHNSHENACKICSEDGLVALCAGMKANVGSALVSEQAVAALKNVFSSVNSAPKGSRRDLSRVHVEACIDAVLRSMGRHLAHVGLQRQACSALGNIALSTEWANAQMDSKGAPQAIISAMLSCCDDAEVQGRACQTLYVLSRDKSNLNRMRLLNRSESGARRPSHVMLRALGRHSRSTQVAKWSMSTVLELSEPKTAKLWSDLANRCGFKEAANDAHRGNAVWGAETSAISKLWTKLLSL